MRRKKAAAPKKRSRAAQLRALKRASERDLIDQIRMLLALPANKRTNFLRKKRPFGGSYL